MEEIELKIEDMPCDMKADGNNSVEMCTDVLKSEENPISEDWGFETVVIPGFSSISVKQEPLDNILDLFEENLLEFEKKMYNKKMLWQVVESNDGANIKDLQRKYIEFIRKAADLEIFKCALCTNFESLHKQNVRIHLLLVHKSDLNLKIYHCKFCRIKKNQIDQIQKHVLLHEDESFPCEFEDIDFQTLNNTKINKHEQFINKKCKLDKLSSKNRKFMCYQCSFECLNKSKLKRHLFEEHQIQMKNMDKVTKTWDCQLCTYKTNLKKSYEIHLLSHKDPEEVEYFYCASCNFKTKHKNYLRHHFLLKHKDPSQVDKKYMCEVCSHRFRVRAKLKIHMLTHKSLSELSKVEECSECPFQTKTKAALYTHMEIHQAPKYICDLCGHPSRRKWNHEMHLLTHKKDIDTEIFRCSVCSYKTKFKARFKMHQQRGNHYGVASIKLRGTGGPQAMDQAFSDNLNFNCYVCNFETSHRKIFSEHSKSHDNYDEVMKKRFLCNTCGFRARHKTHLHTHSVTHKTIDQVEPLKCDKCEFVTKSFHSLASHRQLHKEPKVLYTCDVCGLKNRRKYNHDVHLMTHKSVSDVPMIKCTLCTYQTKFKAYLREHLKKRHNILTARKPGRPSAQNSIS